MAGNLTVGIFGVILACLFWGSNFVVCKGYNLPEDGVHFSFLMSIGILLVGLFSLLSSNQQEGDFQVVVSPYGLLGGALWACGNFLTVPIIQRLGLGVGLATWASANMIVAFLVGAIGLEWMHIPLPEEPLVNPVVGVLGVLCGLVALCLFAIVKSEGDHEFTTVPTSEPFHEEETDIEEQRHKSGAHEQEPSDSEEEEDIEELRAIPQIATIATLGPILLKNSQIITTTQDEPTKSRKPNTDLPDWWKGLSRPEEDDEFALSLFQFQEGKKSLLAASSDWDEEEIIFEEEKQTLVEQQTQTLSCSFSSVDTNEDDPNASESEYNHKGSCFTGNTFLGVAMAVVAGTLYGLQMVPLVIWQNKVTENGYIFNQPLPSDVVLSLRFFFSQFAGIFLMTIFGFVIYCAWTQNKPKLVAPEATLPSIISGVVWAMGCGAAMLATSELGNAVGFVLVLNGTFMVNSVWSVVVFKEIQGRRNLVLFGGAFLLMLLASILISISKVSFEGPTDEAELYGDLLDPLE